MCGKLQHSIVFFIRTTRKFILALPLSRRTSFICPSPSPCRKKGWQFVLAGVEQCTREGFFGDVTAQVRAGQ